MNYKNKPKWQRAPKTITSFTKYEKQMKVPFIIYAHFDALLVPPKKPKSNEVFFHNPCGFGYSIKCCYDDSLSKYEDFYGENSAEVFWEKLEEEMGIISAKLEIRKDPQKLNGEQKNKFSQAQICYFCEEELGNDKHEDWSELTGEFLGAAHKKCQEYKKKIRNFVPVVMHNLSKYSAHFILRVIDDKDLSFAIRENEETFISFSRKLNDMEVRFIDSSRFLLDMEIEELEEILGDDNKHRIRKEFKKKNEFSLMKTKGCFPHHHVKSLQQFSENKLPERDGFYDKLHETEVSDEEYNWAVKVWKTFKCKSVADYFRLYVKSNVLLVEDIFENFRLLCLDKYKLDPAQYYTVAGVAWDAMLKFTKVKLEILKDSDMVKFIKSNIRGGINQCAKRYVKANNMYCPTYDPKVESSFIIYLDANNLAGWAMSQNLPFSEFSWLSNTEIKEIQKKIKDLKSDDDYGYIFEVDLDYPPRLHVQHNDLPFCCQRIAVPPPPALRAYEKSTLNLYDKKNYVIDYRYLQQCMDRGLKLKKIHKVLKFKQSRWLEPYIAYNTKLRREAKNDFEIKLFKLLNNSVYGKTIEKTSRDKPICAGFCILELSKNLMYNFHYSQMIPRYPKGKLNLLYTDTDAFIYEIKTKDLYDDFKKDSKLLELLDTSDMDPKWNISSNKNKKVLGKMKDECNGKVVYEFFGAGSKVYCLNIEGEIIKKAIGVPKYVKANSISTDDYKKCILEDKTIVRKILTTVPKNHTLQTTEIKKNALCPGDTKRYVLENKIDTLAWGFQGAVQQNKK